MAASLRERVAAALPDYDPYEVIAVARSVVPTIEDIDEQRQWRELRIAASTIDSWRWNAVIGLAKRMGENERRRQMVGAFRASTQE